MRMHRHRWLLLVGFCALLVVVLAGHGERAGASHAREVADGARIAAALQHGRLEQRSLVVDGRVPKAERTHSLAPVVIERQGFEGDFPPAGWQVLDRAAQSDRVPARYQWAKETCEVEPLVGGSAAAWVAGGGSEGTKLGCVTPYPAAAKVNAWLSYVMDLTPYPMGFTLRMKLLLDQPLNERGAQTNMQIAIIDLETSEGIAYNISSPAPLTWLPLVLPEEDLAQFGGLAQVAVVIAYQDNPAPGGHVGAVVDNVVLEGLPVEHTATPTATSTPVATATPTPTATPVRKYRFLPALLLNIEEFPRPTPMPMVGAEVVFGTAVDSVTGRVTNQGRRFPAGVAQFCAKERWFGQVVGTSFRWQWYRNNNPVDYPGLNDQITLDTAEGFRHQCVSQPPNGTYEVRVYVGGAVEPTAAQSATIGP